MSEEQLTQTWGEGFEDPRLESTQKETDAKCPNCAAVLNFNPVSGGMKCDYCDYEAVIPDAGSATDVTEMNFQSAEFRGNFEWGAEKKRVLCRNCGAESIYDALEVADVCPFCGSNQVMAEKDVNSLAPNGVAAFQINAKKAEENFHTWIKRRIFAPSKAKKQAKADAFKGVYLPYWTFDSLTTSNYTAQYGRSRTVRDSKGNTRTEIDWYPTSGIHQSFIDDALVSATSQQHQNMLKRVEPFDFRELRPYRPEYLAGFISERYSIGLDDGWKAGQAEMRRMLEGQLQQKIRSENNASHVRGLSFSTRYDKVTYKYLLLPIWLSFFQYKEKDYQFLVNGQTGKVGGNIPISPLRVAIAVALGILLLILVLYFVNS